MKRTSTTGHRLRVSQPLLLLAGIPLLLCVALGFVQAWLWLALALPAGLAAWHSLKNRRTNV